MDLSKLNKEQKIAVEHKKGPLLVLSGAGTGKTRVLTSRFVYIVKNLANMEWKVPTHGESILLWSSVFTLSLISLAALFVKVTAIILLKSTFKFLTI